MLAAQASTDVNMLLLNDRSLQIKMQFSELWSESYIPVASQIHTSTETRMNFFSAANLQKTKLPLRHKSWASRGCSWKFLHSQWFQHAWFAWVVTPRNKINILVSSLLIFSIALTQWESKGNTSLFSLPSNSMDGHRAAASKSFSHETVLSNCFK